VNVPDLLLRVECYVGLRSAIGYTVRYEEKLLKDFVQFVASQDVSSPIRATGNRVKIMQFVQARHTHQGRR